MKVFHSFTSKILAIMLILLLFFCAVNTFAWYRSFTREAIETAQTHLDSLIETLNETFDENLREIDYTTAFISNKVHLRFILLRITVLFSSLLRRKPMYGFYHFSKRVTISLIDVISKHTLVVFQFMVLMDEFVLMELLHLMMKFLKPSGFLRYKVEKRM